MQFPSTPDAEPLAQVRRASNERDLAIINSLWRSVYENELGWIASSLTPTSDCINHVDADYYLATDDRGTGVGTLRILFGPHELLPTFQLAQITLKGTRSDPRFAEFGRLMVVPEWRKRRPHGYPFGIFAGLLQHAIRRCLERDTYFVITNVQCRGYALSLVNSLRLAGFRETGATFPDELCPDNPPCTALILNIHEATIRLSKPNPLIPYLYHRT